MKDVKSNKIGLCALHEWPSLENFLKEWLNPSNQKLKSFFSKVELARPVRSRDSLLLPIDFLNDNLINPHYTARQSIATLAENDVLIALAKPYGVHGHPLRYSEQESVLNFLRSERRDIRWEQFSEREKGLLYRLDQDTSGLVLFIKAASKHQEFRQHFSELVKEKIYYLLAAGEVRERGDIIHRLGPYGPKGARMRVDEAGLEARLEILNASYFSAQDVSLVKVRLHTGLRHQIRVQFEALGHGLIGDPLYGKRAAERLFLHCYSYKLGTDTYCDPNFELLGHYLGLDCRLQVFGDELLIGKSREP